MQPPLTKRTNVNWILIQNGEHVKTGNLAHVFMPETLRNIHQIEYDLESLNTETDEPHEIYRFQSNQPDEFIT